MEKDSLRQVYQAYAKQVFAYLYSLCHDHALAEDLMQEAFVRALCAIDLAQEDILPWLLRVGRNLYFDHYRKMRRQSWQELEEGALPAGEDLLLDQILQKEENRKLYRAILNLKELEKEAVILYWFAGISQTEIGRILNLSHGNVRVVLYRAKKNLKQYLEQEGR